MQRHGALARCGAEQALSRQATRWQPAAFLASALVLTAFAYLGVYLRLPSEGAVIDYDATLDAPGLPLIITETRPGGLQPGDRLLLYQGVPVNALLQDIFGSPLRPALPPPGDTASLVVLRQGRPVPLDVTLAPPSLLGVAAESVSQWTFLAAFLLVGVIVFARRPDLPIASVLLIQTAAMFHSGLIYWLGLPVAGLGHGWMVYAWLIGVVLIYGALVLGPLLHLVLIFPRPWPPVLRYRRLPALLYVLVWLPFLGQVLVLWPRVSDTAGQLVVTLRATNAMGALAFPLVVAFSIYAYWRYANPTERRQLRWFVWGVAVSSVPFLLLISVPRALGLPALISPLLTGLLLCAVPLSLAIAILRERLFDIDLIIQRTLVYSALTLLLGLVYFGSVVLLQSVFQTITGEQRSELVTVLSTLTIAALFTPVRGRVQRAIDRRFYRQRYDAVQALASFSASARDEVDLGSLSRRIIDVVENTMHPEHVSLWLRPDNRAGQTSQPALGPRTSTETLP
jgi:hypothetical protein